MRPLGGPLALYAIGVHYFEQAGAVTITLVGVNHQTAGVETREKLAVSPPDLPARLAAAVACPGVAEALLLSTCNRSELYLAVSECGLLACPELLYGELLGVPADLLEGHTYVLHGAAAVAHVFGVAAGADSMVLGETEIMGQLRQALECARECGAAGRVLSRLGERALAVGRRARTETQIDRGCRSVASVAADLARQIFDDLSRRRLLLLGAGEMGALVARRLADSGTRDLTVVSRTLARAETLAAELGGGAAAFDELVDELMRADIVIAATSAPHPLVTVSRVRAATASGHRRPLLLLDLAVPRDIEPQVRDLDDVYLYDLDDLQAFASRVADQRLCELPLVAQIAEEEARQFMVWAQSQEMVPLVLSIRRQAETVRVEELARLLETAPELSRKADKALHLMTKRLVRRLLSQPLERLRELSCEGLSEREQELITGLFEATAAEDEADAVEEEEASDRPAPSALPPGSGDDG